MAFIDKNDKNWRTSLLAALSGKYDYIAYINEQTNQVHPYIESDEFRAIFDSISPDLPSNLRLDAFWHKVIPPEDMNDFRMLTDRDRSMTQLTENQVYAVTVRMIINGESRYYGIKFARIPNEAHELVMGIINVDEQIRLEQELKEKKLLEKRYQIISILSQKYTGLYYVNVEERKSEVISIGEEIKGDTGEMISQEIDLKKVLKLFVDNLVHPDDREQFEVLKDYDDVTVLLKDTKQYRIVFRRNFNGEYRYTEMIVAKAEDKNEAPVNVAIGFADIDRQQRAKLIEERQQFVISELSEDFDCISYVSLTRDKTEDELTEYRSSETLFKNIPNWNTVDKFSERLDLLMQYVGYAPDMPKFRKETRREVMIKHFERERVYYVNTRMHIDGKLSYYQFKFTPDRDENGELQGMIVGIHNIDDEMKREIELREGVEKLVDVQTEELKNKNAALAKMNETIVSLVGAVVEGRDRDSGKHIHRVKRFTYILASQVMKDLPEYGLDLYTVKTITNVSALHDIGKIMIPDSILLKPGKLTPEEFEVMKTHSEEGYKQLLVMRDNWNDEFVDIALDIVRYHHEKWDGKGYPMGLKGDEIPISAQIVSVADCFDALTSERTYKKAFDPNDAFDMILNGECGAFSDKLMNCFKKCREQFVNSVGSNEDFIVSSGTIHEWENHKTKAFDHLKVLVVDDDALSREIHREILETEGAIVIEAANGAEAVTIIENDKMYDMILMDLHMPMMDGIKATRLIRALPSDRPNIPIFVLSADASEEQTEECLYAGADDFIMKPMSVQELSKAFIRCMKQRNALTQIKLDETIRIANTDSLTSVKSATAFYERVRDVNTDIANKNAPEFAVLMCDVDDLKKENDTYGHPTGDLYIKNCCKILCTVFAHSPVYRIGGDEFVVTLYGMDYNNKDALLVQLEGMLNTTKKIDSSENGKASLSYGISVYDPINDKSMSDVLIRADSDMYAKKRRKNG